MSERTYIQHGRRHGRGGSDPVLGGGATAYLWGVFSSQTIPDSDATAVQWEHFQTNDASVFNTDTANNVWPGPYNNSAGDSYVYFTGEGSYVAAGAASLVAGSYAQAVRVTNDGEQWDLDLIGGYDPYEAIANNTDAFGVGGNQHGASRRLFYVDSSTLPGRTTLEVFQTSGTSKALVEVTLGIVYGDGGTGDLTQIY